MLKPVVSFTALLETYFCHSRVGGNPVNEVNSGSPIRSGMTQKIF